MINIRRSLFASGLALLLVLSSAASMASVRIGLSVSIAPPELPIYEQPPVPAPGYIWVPGYWAWGDDGYYWVPGTWVLPPEVGLLWTPGYWSWADGVYLWHAGYWGRQVGFYGGINYGFGYFGSGYEGGHWDHGNFYYNRACNNVRDAYITNVYNRTVTDHGTVNRASYNGGAIGVQAHPTQRELAAAREAHVDVADAQLQHERGARNTPGLRARFNGGHPPIAATARPGAFHDPSVIRPMPDPAAPAPARNGFSIPAHKVLEPRTRYAQAPRAGVEPPARGPASEPPAPGAVLSPTHNRRGSAPQVDQRPREQYRPSEPLYSMSGLRACKLSDPASDPSAAVGR